MEAGRRAKAELGGYVGGGPAFGVRADAGELVTDDAERAVLEPVLAEHEAGQSILWVPNIRPRCLTCGFASESGGRRCRCQPRALRARRARGTLVRGPPVAWITGQCRRRWASVRMVMASPPTAVNTSPKLRVY